MRKLLYILSLIAFILTLSGDLSAELQVRIKDLANIDGLKENQVFGFGIVVGLQGSGDSKSMLAGSSLKSLLKNIGITDDTLKTKNIASVLLTAKLPAYARIGDRLDVNVSSIGDAKSLEGGILVQSPLMGADGQIYLVCQGKLSFDNGSQNRKIKTSAKVINGGLIEKEISPEIITENSIRLVLKEWDFTVADNILKAITDEFPDSKPELINDGKIKLIIPANVNLTKFISTIENIEVSPSHEARVVINERDGTIVMGGDVKISGIVISKDGMTIKVNETGQKAGAAEFKESSSVKDIVDSLNYLGVNTLDIISILKAINDAGALHGRLIIN